MNILNLQNSLLNAVAVSLNSDLPETTEKMSLETNNYERAIKSDLIYTKLQNICEKNDYLLVQFKKSAWKCCLVLDPVSKSIVCITTIQNFRRVQKLKNKVSPHYMQSLAYVLNDNTDILEQITLLPNIESAYHCDYHNDFNKIFSDFAIDTSKFTFYILAYEHKSSIITNVEWYKPNMNLEIVESTSLLDLLIPDPADLTTIPAQEPKITNDNIIQHNKSNIEDLLTVKNNKNEKKKADN